MQDDPPFDAASGDVVPKHPKAAVIEEVVTFRLSRLVGVMNRAGDHWSERLFDLNINEWRLLALVQSHGNARAGDFSELLLMDKSQMSRLIKSLTAKRLIRSKPDQDDARAVVLKLTPKGLEIFERMMGEVMRSNERVLAPLSAQEVALFSDILDRLIGHNVALLRARLEE